MTGQQLTFGELRQLLTVKQARWTIDPAVNDVDIVPVHPLGVLDATRLVPIGQVARLDLKQILHIPPANPFLLQRRIDLNILPATFRPQASALPPAVVPAVVGSARETVVDWRNRWGWPWITTVQDQGLCESCWTFGATALVESMVRIEHAVWSKRSEGDVHDGMGCHCGDRGWPDLALNWIQANGLADPDCYPYKTDNSPYNPTPDRSGRTVRINDYITIGDVEQQKVWLDTVGPLTACFEIFQDFDAYHSGVYHHVYGSSRGLHCILIVGYDDNQGCWVVKNSWGTAWGNKGYILLGYGEVSIDTWGKYGLQYSNPDPWTKRRLHSGVFVESGNGALHCNFDMLATTNGNQIQYWWRNNSVDRSWQQASRFGNDAAVCPTLTQTTYNRNFEFVHLTTSNQLHHWILDQATGQWADGGIFGPTDAAGVPGFIQSNYGAPGNFEVVVRTADGRLNHWWRTNGAPWTWYDGGRFGSNVLLSGPALIQSNYGRQGNFELVCVLNTGQMQHWWRDNDNGRVWNAGPTFGSGIYSPPCMIEGQYGMGNELMVGNFELCVAVGGQIQYWWHDNVSGMGWHQSATFGHDVQAVVGLIESSYGFNLEVVVLRTDQMLQHYWRDGNGWHEGVVIGSAR